MKNIKYLIILFLLYIINIPNAMAATFLNATNNRPVVGSSFDIKFNIDYGADSRVAEGHYKITYNSSCFEYQKYFFSQQGGVVRNEPGVIYLDKEFSTETTWGSGAPVSFTFKPIAVCSSSSFVLEATGDAKYVNGTLIDQALVPTAISSIKGDTDTQLNNLYVINYDIIPAFNKTITSYALTVNGDVSQIEIVAEKGNSAQTIKGAGKHSLNYGDNRINIEVKSENGSTAIYEIMVTRKDNRFKNTDLKSLSVSNTDIKLEKDKYEYSAIVSRSVSNVFISATPEAANSTLTGTGSKELAIGLNSFDLNVTADDGSTRTYTINITRSTEELQKEIESTNLLSLEINGVSIPLTDNDVTYLVGIPKGADKLNIVTVAESRTSNVVVNGNENLKPGINIIDIVVTEKNDTKKEYHLIGYRMPDESSILSTIDPLNPAEAVGTPMFTSSADKHVISASTITSIKSINNTIIYNVVNNNGGLLYQVKLNPAMEAKDTDITFVKQNDSPLTYSTEIPAGLEVKMYINADQYKNGTSIKIYTYNEKGNYNILSEAVPVEDGYITFITNGDKNYIFTTQQLVTQKTLFSKIADKIGNIVIIFLGCIAALFVISSLINHAINSKMKDEPLY